MLALQLRTETKSLQSGRKSNESWEVLFDVLDRWTTDVMMRSISSDRQKIRLFPFGHEVGNVFVNKPPHE